MSKRAQISALRGDLDTAVRCWANRIDEYERRVLALEQAAKAQPELVAQSKAKALHHASSCNLSLGLPCNCQAQPEPVAPAKPGRWKPEMGEDYWTTGRSTIVGSEWMNDETDNFRWLRGDVHPTEAAAQYADDRGVALQAMHDWALARFVPDWKDATQPKVQLICCHGGRGWEILTRDYTQYNDWPIFATEADCREFLAEFGDRMFYLLERTMKGLRDE